MRKRGPDGATVTLPGGGKAVAQVHAAGVVPGPVSVAIRPEDMHLTAAEDKSAAIRGRIGNVVYFGSGNNVHVTLADGTEVIVRSNEAGAVDSPVGIAFSSGKLQVLED